MSKYLNGLGGLKETKMFLPHPPVKISIVGSLRGREVACSASDLQGLNFASCVWRAVLSHSSHYPQEFILAQFSLYMHKSGLKPDSFHLYLYNYNYYRRGLPRFHQSGVVVKPNAYHAEALELLSRSDKFSFQGNNMFLHCVSSVNPFISC